MYRPQLDVQCCPMYTIKCDALQFKISNSQKKVIKHFNRYLNYDIKPKSSEEVDIGQGEGHKDCTQYDGHQECYLDSGPSHCDSSFGFNSKQKVRNIPKPGIGADKEKPKCSKAKLMRQAKKREKLAQKGKINEEADEVHAKKSLNSTKSLEEYLNETVDKPKHKLRIELLRSDVNADQIIATSHSVYYRYQTVIHQDKPSSPVPKQFKKFLITSPLIYEKKPIDGHPGYGSFHQQYWIDDELVAVGVIDILPNCISSVYLFYDPKFSFLSLGTYTALQEIAFVKKLQQLDENLSSYYMGFYIHSCPKMKYKAQFSPSFLLCPETFTWHTLSNCFELLALKKYCRFAGTSVEDKDSHDAEIGDVGILYRGRAMKYSDYLRLVGNASGKKEVEVYAGLVGKCSRAMLLFRS